VNFLVLTKSKTKCSETPLKASSEAFFVLKVLLLHKMELEKNIFQKALEYAYKVVHSINPNPFEQEDLIQDFCYQVLNNPEKYHSILQHKSTVYNILKGLNSNAIRKKKPIYTDSFSDYQVQSNEKAFDQRSREQIESILYIKIKPNGRKDSLLPYQKQKEIISNYPKRKGTMRAYCKEHQISTATLHRLLKNGPGKIKTPLSITYFLMYHFDGKSINDIAEMHQVSKHSVSQNIHTAKKAILEYFEEQDLMNTNLEPVFE
jgi:DNA-directed RNA polymerase specialized sigma24 family protein